MNILLGLVTLMMPLDPPPPPPPKPPGLYFTVYDPSAGGINCDYGECAFTALTNITDGMYRHTAACPSSWLGHITTTVIHVGDSEFFCVDAFGDPKNRVMVHIDGDPFYRIDLMYRPAAEHPWNQEKFPREMWWREWRPMAEFYELRAKWDAEVTLN